MSDPPSVEQISNEVYNNFAAEMHEKYVTPGKICEKCGDNPAVKINRWGQIKACCQSCLDEEMAIFNEHCEAERKYEEEYGW
jgi:hypothetical protein